MFYMYRLTPEILRFHPIPLFYFFFTVTLSSIFSLKILQEWGVSSFFRNRFELFVNDGKKNQNRKIRFENF